MILVLAMISVPLFVFAASLIPCGGSGVSDTPTSACTLCDLYLLAQNIMKFLMWQVTPIIAIFALSWAGFKILISGPNPGLRNEGFGIMKKTLIGVLIVFSSWIIINEVLLFFSGTSATAGVGGVLSNPWNAVSCALPPAAISGPAYDGPGAPAAQAQPRTILLAAGINANINYCGYFGPPNQTFSCTTLVQLPQSAIAGLINLREGCACTIYITGGTEIIGHATHGPGIPVVDVQKNTALDNYILGIAVTPPGPVVSDIGTTYTDSAGNTYLDEVSVNNQGPHWHIVFQ